MVKLVKPRTRQGITSIAGAGAGVALVLLTAFVLAGCGRTPREQFSAAKDAPPTTTTPGVVRQAAPANTPIKLTASQATVTTAATPPHFDTPDAAMRYLTAAYNRADLTALKHVTTPAARVALVAMMKGATNLRLTGCTARTGMGDYTCTFSHEYPASMHKPGKGEPAVFVVGPADTPGWYMTVFESCGCSHPGSTDADLWGGARFMIDRLG